MPRSPKNKQPNKRLHRCEECGEKRMVAWVELNRASRPRCFGCGSSRLELVSEEAKEDATRLQRERVKGSGGSLKMRKDKENTTHKKVV